MLPIFKMVNVVMKSLFSKPATLMYPVVPNQWKERTRGHISIDIDDCIFCGICSKKCPTNALTVDRNEKEWSIERMRCVQCNCCVEVCPKKCLNMEKTYTPAGVEKVTDSFNARVSDNPADS